MKEYRVHSFILKPSHPAYKTIDDMALNARFLRNYLNYQRRQNFFDKKPFLSELELRKEMTKTKPQEWTNLPSKIARDVSRSLDESWRSFFALKKKFPNEKHKMPGYLKGNQRAAFTVSKDAIRISGLRNGVVTLTKMSQPLCKLPFDASLLRCVRIIPEGKNFRIELIWKKKIAKPKDSGVVAGIDLGLDNLMSVACDDVNVKPLLIDGKHLKWLNRKVNREVAKEKSFLSSRGLKSSNTITSMWRNRNNAVKAEIHWATKQVVNYCVENNVSEVIVGWNKGWKSNTTKDGNTLGKRNNQAFRSIPMRLMLDILTYKLEEHGISVIETEESYTSKTSVIDKELPKKHKAYKGRRVKRGLFRSSQGVLINADVNGAAQIVRKCKPNAFNWVDGVTVKQSFDKPIKVRYGEVYCP